MLSFNEYRENVVEVDLSKLQEELEKLSEIVTDLDTFLNGVSKIMLEYGIELEYPEVINEEYVHEVFQISEKFGLIVRYDGTDPSPYNMAYIVEMEPEKYNDGEYETPGHFEITQSLLIRLMEFARETAKDDLILHKVVDKMNSMNEPEYVFDADDYDEIMKV